MRIWSYYSCRKWLVALRRLRLRGTHPVVQLNAIDSRAYSHFPAFLHSAIPIAYNWARNLSGSVLIEVSRHFILRAQTY